MGQTASRKDSAASSAPAPTTAPASGHVYTISPDEFVEYGPDALFDVHKSLGWEPKAVPPGLYGNDLDPSAPRTAAAASAAAQRGETERERERPGHTHWRNYAFGPDTIVGPAVPTDKPQPRGIAVAFAEPIEIAFPALFARKVRLDAAQVHALAVGVGRKSMDDRWMGRLWFQADGTAVVGLFRTWSGCQIYEVTFKPVHSSPTPASDRGVEASTRDQGTSATSLTGVPASVYADAPDAYLPSRFGAMELQSMRREACQERYKMPLPKTVVKAASDAVAGVEYISIATAREELKGALDILFHLINMRVGIDDGTWISY